MEKENWINDIMESANGRQQAIPDAFLFSGIMQQVRRNNRVQSKTVWLVAASIALLVALNFTVLKNTSSHKNNVTESLAATLDQSNQLY